MAGVWGSGRQSQARPPPLLFKSGARFLNIYFRQGRVPPCGRGAKGVFGAARPVIRSSQASGSGGLCLRFGRLVVEALLWRESLRGIERKLIFFCSTHHY